MNNLGWKSSRLNVSELLLGCGFSRAIETFMIFFRQCIVGTLVFSVCQSGYAENVEDKLDKDHLIAVVYPETREPYRQIFLSIIQGIEDSHDGNVVIRELESDYASDDLWSWLKDKDIQTVIALGQRGLNSMESFQNPPLTIVGGALLNPAESKYSGVSLAPSPVKIFPLIRKIVPQVKRIFVIGNDSEQWLLETARTICENESLELALEKATSIQDVALKYREVLRNMDSKTDALWISADGMRLAKPILNSVLETAWSRNLMVFSSNLSDVKRGALFSFYANHKEMGKELVGFSKKMDQAPKADVRIVPTESVSVAINLRTADHLNLYYDKNMFKTFSLMYPPPLDH